MPSISPNPHTQAHARFWNRWARRYAAMQVSDPAGYEATLARTQALLGPEHSVLEIGCGTGATAMRLAPSVGQMLAGDVSPAMIQIARERLTSQPLPQLRFTVGDADSLLSTSAAFDAVLAFNLLHLLPDLDAAIMAMRSALRPGGCVISKTPCLTELPPVIRRLMLPILRALRIVPPIRPVDPEVLKTAFLRHGFAIEAVERHGHRGRDFRIFIVARVGGEEPNPAKA